MTENSVTYRISPALFAEYCYFSLFKTKNYRLLRTVSLVAVTVAGLLTALVGLLYKDMNITFLGGAVVLVTVMVPFVQKKYIKSRYKLVYGKNLTQYTATFAKGGAFTISAGEITEKYTKNDIKCVYCIRGGYAVSTANKATFLVPLADTLPDREWFKKTYGNKFKVCA